MSLHNFAIFYHQNRRKAKDDNRFYGNRIFLSLKSDRFVAAKKSPLNVAHKKLDVNENGCSCINKNNEDRISFLVFLRPLTHINLPRRNINRSTVTHKARASWKHGGFPFGFMTLLMC